MVWLRWAKEVQRHRLLISTGSSGAACHGSAISTARALLNFFF
jgi:hypothetical protein